MSIKKNTHFARKAGIHKFVIALSAKYSVDAQLKNDCKRLGEIEFYTRYNEPRSLALKKKMHKKFSAIINSKKSLRDVKGDEMEFLKLIMPEGQNITLDTVKIIDLFLGKSYLPIPKVKLYQGIIKNYLSLAFEQREDFYQKLKLFFDRCKYQLRNDDFWQTFYELICEEHPEFLSRYLKNFMKFLQPEYHTFLCLVGDYGFNDSIIDFTSYGIGKKFYWFLHFLNSLKSLCEEVKVDFIKSIIWLNNKNIIINSIRLSDYQKIENFFADKNNQNLQQLTGIFEIYDFDQTNPRPLNNDLHTDLKYHSKLDIFTKFKLTGIHDQYGNILIAHPQEDRVFLN